MSIRTFAWKNAFAILALLIFPACKSFQVPGDAGAHDSGNPGGGGRGLGVGGGGRGGGAAAGSGGMLGPSTDAADAPDMGSGAGAGGSPVSGCVAGTTRLCKDDPDHVALGNCGNGSEPCIAGTWGPCSVQPAAKDSCALQGDDATCNGQPNEGCPCVSGTTQACGPAADVGVCKRGAQTCTNGAWGACVGEVFAAARDCTSTADNNCDGMPDNTVDAVCACTLAAARPCDDHPGKDGTGRCKAGSQTCVIAADKKTSSWGTCSGSVGPTSADTCVAGNDDNCNGVPNEGCACVAGTTQPCGPAANVGICKRGTQTCTAGTWGACTGAVSAAARDCTSSADNNCDGIPDNTVDATCACPSGGSQACGQHPGKDGNGPCKAGSQSCVVAADKKSSAWGSCIGAVGPASADTCGPTSDENCNGIPHDSCTCANGDVRPCGPAAIGICKPSTQVCTGGMWPSTCPGAVTALPRDCSSTKDNDCDGTADNLDTSTCKCNYLSTTAIGCPVSDPCITGNQACVLSADHGSTSVGNGTCAVKTGTSCGSASCANDMLKPAGTCGGTVSAPTCSSGGSPAPCANNHACMSTTACSQTCSGSAGCTSGYYCSGGNNCSLQKSNGALCGAGMECKSNVCGGRCCATQPCNCPQPSAQNLFSNADPGFDSMSTIGSWLVPLSPSNFVGYVADDADGCIYSGAIVKPSVNDGFGNPGRCVNISAGGQYTFGLSAKIPMPPTFNVFYCAIFRWGGPNCTGDDDGDSYIANSDIDLGSVGVSLPWTSSSRSFTVPTDGTAQSLQMRCPDGDTPVYIDKVFLSQGFSGGF
jgi:hypothetical protein